MNHGRKTEVCILSVIFTLAVFAWSAAAASVPEPPGGTDSFSDAVTETEDPARAYYVAVWDMLDPETEALLRAFGLQDDDAESIFSLRPESLFGALGSLFSDSLPLLRRGTVHCLLQLLLLGVFLSFFSDGANRELAEVLGTAVLLFSLTSFTAQTVERCVAAVTLTADLIRGLIPVYAGVIAFSGNPGVALQYQTLVFAYAEGVGAFFASILPLSAAVGTAVLAAGALLPSEGTQSLAGFLQKGARFLMGAVAGVFSAVLAVRSVLAEAGDTVAVKGLRFLVGGVVPVVGSAVGDALNSLVAGLALAKSGVGLLAILAVTAINLPALCALFGWSLALGFLEIAAGLCVNKRLCGFLKGLRGLCATAAAALIFNVCVYVIAQAIVLRTKGGG